MSKRVAQGILSTTIPTELMDLLKEKSEALRECGIANVTASSLAASFLASQMEDIEDIEPDEIAEGLKGESAYQDPATFLHHLSMRADMEVITLLKEKVRAIKKVGCTSMSLSSLTASFLMSQFDEISSLDPHEMAADLIAVGGTPEKEGKEETDASGTTGDSEGGDSPEGAEAEGPEADKDSPGEDHGGPGEASDSGDEEVSEGKED